MGSPRRSPSPGSGRDSSRRDDRYRDDRHRDDRYRDDRRDSRRGDERRIYVGQLPRDAREREVEDLLRSCGRIRHVEMKNGYAFVEFDDERDAADAIRRFDGHRMGDDRIVVERVRARGGAEPGKERCFNCGSHGHWSRDCPDPPGRGQRSRRYDEGRCFECGESGHRARDCPSGRGAGRGNGGPRTDDGPRYESHAHRDSDAAPPSAAATSD